MKLMYNTDQSKRKKAIRLADAINATEGVPVQSDARRLSQEWARGEITSAEMKRQLIAKHFRPAGFGNE